MNFKVILRKDNKNKTVTFERDREFTIDNKVSDLETCLGVKLQSVIYGRVRVQHALQSDKTFSKCLNDGASTVVNRINNYLKQNGLMNNPTVFVVEQ